MRDPRRIHEFCKRLEAAWLLLPDWRFGQLMMNIFTAMKSERKDPFFIEDDRLLEFVENYISKLTGVPLN